MEIAIYLDDERTPKKEFDIIVRNYEDCIEAIKNNKVYLISLDHDLGRLKTGYDVAMWLVENDIEIPNVNIHSMNVVGSQNIRKLLKRYFPNIRITIVKGV